MIAPRQTKNLFCPGRKIVARGKFDALTRAQRETIVRWLTVNNITYAEAAKRIAAEFGISISDTALSVFYKKHCQTVTLPQPAARPGTVIAEVVIQVRIPQTP